MLPKITIIIPARPEQTQVLATQAVKKLDYPQELLEVLVVRGKQPSVQRNTAIRQSTGELIYFLDDDSIPHPEILKKAVKHFEDPQIAMLGGPNICPANAPALEQVFAQVMASWIAFGPSRARYCQVGETRDSSEKELILCNLLARKSTLLKYGCFDEKLYPNEENALMEDITKGGNKLIYDPDFVVERRPRQTLSAFFRMLRTYGRGRAEQFRLHPGWGSLLNFVPPAFVIYLAFYLISGLTILTKLLCNIAISPFCKIVFPGMTLILLLYLSVLFAQTVSTAKTKRLSAAGLFCFPPLLAITHIMYGSGFWSGFIAPKYQRHPSIAPSDINVEKLQ